MLQNALICRVVERNFVSICHLVASFAYFPLGTFVAQYCVILEDLGYRKPIKSLARRVLDLTRDDAIEMQMMKTFSCQRGVSHTYLGLPHGDPRTNDTKDREHTSPALARQRTTCPSVNLFRATISHGGIHAYLIVNSESCYRTRTAQV